MIIKLIENFYIETDPHNFILKQTYIGKDEEGNEKEQIRIIGYYPTIEHALQSLVRHKALSGEDKLTVEEYVRKTRKWTDELASKVRLIAKEVQHEKN